MSEGEKRVVIIYSSLDGHNWDFPSNRVVVPQRPYFSSLKKERAPGNNSAPTFSLLHSLFFLSQVRMRKLAFKQPLSAYTEKPLGSLAQVTLTALKASQLGMTNNTCLRVNEPED